MNIHRCEANSSPYVCPRELIPGQWIVFYNDDHSKFPNETPGPYKVIHRTNYMSYGSCFLMNEEEKIVDSEFFCELGCKARILSKEEIEATFGEKLKKLQTVALEKLKCFAQHHHFGKPELIGLGFNPDNEKEALSMAQIREKYNLVLANRSN